MSREMSNHSTCLAAITLLLLGLVAPAAHAARTFCCTDEKGQQRCGDVLPEACRSRAYVEYNEAGTRVRNVAAPLTEAQQAAVDAEQKKKREIAEAAERQQRADQALLSTYADEKVLLLEAIHLNAIHGERLTHYDMRRCVILCEQLHVPAAKIAAALNLTLDKFKRISETEVHRDEEGHPVSAAKQASMHLIDQDKPITDRQNSALSGMIGSGQTFTINQVSRLIEGRLLNKSDERIMAALERLYGLLRGIFEKKENAA